MADPVTLGLLGVSAATTLAGTFTQAAGAEAQAQAQSTMANYQAGVATINANIAKQQATYDEAVGEVQTEQSAMRTGQQVGRTRAIFGASNVEGSSKEAVIQSEKEVGAQDQGIIQAVAAKKAYGSQVTAAEDTSQSKLYGFESQTALTAGDIQATSSIIGGVGNVASKWAAASTAFGGATGSTVGTGKSPDFPYADIGS